MKRNAGGGATSKEPLWISHNLLDTIHTDLIEQYGGTQGVHDVRLIESALARPRNLFFYHPETSIVELAAALAFGIAKNHGYRDGNKRAAFAAAAVFLKLNGYRLTASEEDAVSSIVLLATDRWDQAGFAAWLGDHLEAAKPKRVR